MPSSSLNVTQRCRQNTSPEVMSCGRVVSQDNSTVSESFNLSTFEQTQWERRNEAPGADLTLIPKA